MNRVCAIAVVVCLVGGCRSADKTFDPASLGEPLAQGYVQPAAASGNEHPLGSDDRAGVSLHEPVDTPQLVSPAVTSYPVASDPVVRPVAYGPPVANGLEASSVRFSATEPLPTPPLPTTPSVPLEMSALSLADLEGMALQSNPTLAEASARVEAAQGNWLQVGLLPNPAVGYSGQQLGSGGLATQQGVYVGQEIITGKKLRLNRDVASWEVQRAEQELEAFRLRVLTDVRIGYYEVLIAQRRRDLAADLVRISNLGVKAAQTLYRSHEASEVDPLRARVEADTARILLQNSINQHVESWRQLTAFVGMPTLELQRLAGTLNVKGIELTWRETLRQLLQESPEMAAAIADVETARRAVARARAEVIPNVDVQAVVQDDRGTGATNGNLQVSLPIPVWNRNQGRIQQAEAEVAAAEQAVDRLAMDLQSRLAGAFQRYESARNQLQMYSRQDGIIANVERTLELVRAGYEAGEIPELDLLSAQRRYFETNLAYLDSLREQSVSAAEIRGMLLRDSLPK